MSCTFNFQLLNSKIYRKIQLKNKQDADRLYETSTLHTTTSTPNDHQIQLKLKFNFYLTSKSRVRKTFAPIII
jgi:hypothetical protein